jgi:hypothetical protein
MHLYRKSIVIFGIIIPVMAAAMLVGIGFFIRSKMVASFDAKQKNYKTYVIGRIAGRQIESEVERLHQHINRWNSQLSQETASTVTTYLREICEHLPSKEIQQTAFERPSTKSGFGTISAQNSSQIRIAFRGTYRTIQRAFLELETRMPQLQLQELRIDPSSAQSSLLNFQASYTAWER